MLHQEHPAVGYGKAGRKHFFQKQLLVSVTPVAEASHQGFSCTEILTEIRLATSLHNQREPPIFGGRELAFPHRFMALENKKSG